MARPNHVFSGTCPRSAAGLLVGKGKHGLNTLSENIGISVNAWVQSKSAKVTVFKFHGTMSQVQNAERLFRDAVHSAVSKAKSSKNYKRRRPYNALKKRLTYASRSGDDWSSTSGSSVSSSSRSDTTRSSPIVQKRSGFSALAGAISSDSDSDSEPFQKGQRLDIQFERVGGIAHLRRQKEEKRYCPVEHKTTQRNEYSKQSGFTFGFHARVNSTSVAKSVAITPQKQSEWKKTIAATAARDERMRAERMRAERMRAESMRAAAEDAAKAASQADSGSSSGSGSGSNSGDHKKTEQLIEELGISAARSLVWAVSLSNNLPRPFIKETCGVFGDNTILGGGDLLDKFIVVMKSNDDRTSNFRSMDGLYGKGMVCGKQVSAKWSVRLMSIFDEDFEEVVARAIGE